MDSEREQKLYTYQEDIAPSHRANRKQEGLNCNLQDHITQNIRPLRSPDLNPLGYCVWGVVEREVNQRPHKIVASLKTVINSKVYKIDKADLICTCKSFRYRIASIIAAVSIFIKQIRQEESQDYSYRFSSNKALLA